MSIRHVLCFGMVSVFLFCGWNFISNKYIIFAKRGKIMGLLRTIFFLIVFYYIFKFVGRVVAPYLLAKGVNRMTNQHKKQKDFAEKKKKEEGKITIQKTKDTQKMTDSDLGDYVDFEELK